MRVVHRRLQDAAILSVWRPLSPVHFTPRELAVLAKICDSVPSEVAARSLGMAVSTFQTHRRRILEKTGCYGNASIALWARENGLH